MWLINAQTLVLKNFQSTSTTPPYAILSHTWRGDEEITFRELRNLDMSLRNARLKTKSKLGYQKVTKCCVQALEDGLQYVWVDTCCIDKSSSAELSEAINSMFAWYKNASVCYAYLDDIDLLHSSRRHTTEFAYADPKRFWNQAIDLISEKDLSQARWFTRGWTLQELIAPKNVVFYVKGWKCIGNKTSMKSKLARITGIDEQTLTTRNLEAVSVSRRMSWASKRVTTRTEDIAYCLLGIFDVNMPLLYGEGEKAFVRLQEEIMKNSEDQSLFAWSPLNATEVWDLDLVVPMGPEEGSSIFANSPKEFANAGTVRPTSSRGEPYMLTNKGVRMDIPILPLERGLFLVILECNYEGDLSQQLSIVVQKLHGGSSNQFVRHDMVGMIKISQAMIQRAEVGTVYLCKKILIARDFSSVFKVFSDGALGEVKKETLTDSFSMVSFED